METEKPETEKPEAETPASPEKPEAERKEPGDIPYARFKEANEARREAERRYRDSEAKFSMLEGRLEELRRSATPEAKPEDPAADPIKTINDLAQWRKQVTEETAKQSEQEQRFQQFNTAVQTQIDEYRGEHPDYDAAIEFLAGRRDSQLKKIGWKDAGERMEVMKREANAIFAKALQDGVNPGERVYGLAEEMGYKKAEEGSSKPNGATASERLRTIAAGQGAARSLSNAAGAATKPLTLQALADMPRDEFRKIAGDPKKWRQLMTGQG